MYVVCTVTQQAKKSNAAVPPEETGENNARGGLWWASLDGWMFGYCPNIVQYSLLAKDLRSVLDVKLPRKRPMRNFFFFYLGTNERLAMVFGGELVWEIHFVMLNRATRMCLICSLMEGYLIGG